MWPSRGPIRMYGTMLLWFLLIYGLGRAATDLLRGDTEGRLYLDLWGLTQLLCLAAAMTAAVLLLVHSAKTDPAGELSAKL